MAAQDNQPVWLADRRDSDSLKWGLYRHTDILPMWVADMDVRCAEPILAALHQRIDHGVFGYTLAPEAAVEAVCRWLADRYHWTIEPDWIVWTPGLVAALNVVCRAFADTEEAVLTLTPIYPPFLEAPLLSRRQRVCCPLANDHGRYHIDLDAVEAALTDTTRVLLLSSPHNPVGRVWDRADLLALGQLCVERAILLCSDEIHCDLGLDPTRRHVPTASLDKAIAGQTVTLMSPAKTFNLPGLNCGFAVIANPALRQRYQATARGIVPWVNTLGFAACRAALTEGRPWLDAVLAALRQNHRVLLAAINAMEGLSMQPVEATYLAWIDARPLGLENPAAFFKEAGVAMSDGADFGQAGFVRLNFACAPATLEEAIRRIGSAVRHHTGRR